MRTFLLSLVSLGLIQTLYADEAAKKKTVAYIQSLQVDGGGFLSTAPAPNIRIVPTLKGTSSAVRALHYWGGEIPNKAACVAFIEKCYHPAQGAFSDLPGGEPDHFTTAVGAMAVKQIGMDLKPYQAGVAKYLTDYAKSFEDIRIAAAGLENVDAKSPKQKAWRDEILKLQNPDGSFGKDAGVARMTASSVVTILRMGDAVPKHEALVPILRKGQREDGGYGKEESPTVSDLETSYRVMRCFAMLKAEPDAGKLRAFVEKCRNADGGYGMSPGQSSNISGTYFAGILHYWLDKGGN